MLTIRPPPPPLHNISKCLALYDLWRTLTEHRHPGIGLVKFRKIQKLVCPKIRQKVVNKKSFDVAIYIVLVYVLTNMCEEEEEEEEEREEGSILRD